ncbi:MAG: endonuclease/exonuclease/phosphatase family protein [Actinoplanes sp.]
MTLRFLTWNVKTGGSGGRLGALVSLIERERPDILALQELRDFQKHGGRRMREVADAVGMTPFLAPSVFGQAVAVLVRPPLRIVSWSAVRWRLHHAAASVVVPTAAGQLTVVSTHLNAISPYRRMREARWLAARHRPAKGPVLLAGDLNSLDPGNDHQARLAGLPERYARRHLGPDGTPDTRAIAAFTAAGFVDLGAAGGEFTVPTTQGGGHEFSDAGMRLDYLMAGPSIAALAGSPRVVRGGEAEFASDHYPLAVELDL